jgi:hypothetical protein
MAVLASKRAVAATTAATIATILGALMMSS